MYKVSFVIYIFLMNKQQYGFSRYLPVNSSALRWEIYCKGAGYAQIPPGADYPLVPEEHPKNYAERVKTGRVLREFQVVYVTSGTGWFEDSINGRRDIGAGDMCILFPGVKHAYSPYKETGWQEYWVEFAGAHADRLRENGLFGPVNPIHHIGINRAIIADYEQIVQFCRQQTPGFQVLLGVMVLQLLAHLHVSEISSKTSHEDSELVQTARSIMQLHLEDGIEVKHIAKELGVSYARLLKIFRQYTGLTPYQYYLQLRVYRAQELLQQTEFSVKEVAATMNFENQYYFSRIFKKKTGMRPTEWKAGPVERQAPVSAITI